MWQTPLSIVSAPKATPCDSSSARAELEGQGIEFAQETIDSGVCHMAIFRDPDGNGLMLHHRYAPKGERGDAEGAAEKAAG